MNETPVFWDLTIVQHPVDAPCDDSDSEDDDDKVEEHDADPQHECELPVNSKRQFFVPNVQQLEGGDALVLDTEHSEWIVKTHHHDHDVDESKACHERIPATTSNHSLSFRTNILKSNETALRDVEKYFPHLVDSSDGSENDWIVCIGEMVLVLDDEE
ncbi:hypothetical protein HDU98_007926 [Podochytrium sp. JEL0797]|nr:hypothetical protein HDU98_007926 [Podochytrium sp. JEL0797]